jgi:hypothetical protein
MSQRHYRRLLTSVLAGLLFSAPAIAFGQPDDETETSEDEDDVDLDEPVDEDDDIPAPTEDTSGDSGGGEVGDGWGVGGDEPEGKYKPSGKTGKLAELEEEEEEEEEAADGPPDLPPPGTIAFDSYFGFGNVLVVQQDQGGTEVSPTAAFIIGLGYRIADQWEITARFGLATNKSNGPRDPFVPEARDPDSYKQVSTGGFELGVRPWFNLSRDFAIIPGIAFTLPTGSGAMFAGPDDRANLGKRVVNVAAAAATGYRERAMFASKRFGITPSAMVRYLIPDVGPGRIRIEGDTKIEIMVKTGGTDPLPEEQLPPNTEAGELKSTAVNWVLGGGGNYDLWDEMLQVGLRMWLAVGTAEETVGSFDPGGAQFVFEPNIGTHIDFTDDEAFGLDGRFGAILPAGGELGGGGPTNSKITGLRVTLGLFF